MSPVRGYGLIRSGLVALAAMLALAVASTAGASETHVIDEGETLSEVAARYGVPIATIVEINDIESIHLVRAGQVIQLQGDRTTHVVSPGDTLSMLAARFGISISQLVTENDIGNPDRILAGTELVIPGTVDTAVGGRYIVRHGDTLTAIASRHGVGAWALAQWNGIGNANLIREGQVLRLEQPSFTHAVERNDSLSAIAARFGVPLDVLVETNGIADANRLLAGSQLRVPTAVPVDGRVIGTSVEGREIVAFTLGRGTSTVALVGGLHAGPEEETIHLVQRLFAEFSQANEPIPEGIALVFVPRANPDGHVLPAAHR